MPAMDVASKGRNFKTIVKKTENVVIVEEQRVETRGPKGICIFAISKETSREHAIWNNKWWTFEMVLGK